jgi:co-chaperonin GroES (HSP10)
MTHSSLGIKTKGGVLIGFDINTTFADEENSWPADLAEVYAKVYKLPDKLYYNKEDTHGMSWDCDLDLDIGDFVWFNTIESYNSVEIECEDKIYKLIPYSDIYVRRKQGLLGEVECLNGYVLLRPVYKVNTSALAVSKQGEEDKTRGVVKFLGKPNREYSRPEYVDFKELSAGDMVLFNPNTAVFRLERKAYLARFDNDNIYNVVQRRRISMVLSKGN